MSTPPWRTTSACTWWTAKTYSRRGRWTYGAGDEKVAPGCLPLGVDHEGRPVQHYLHALAGELRVDHRQTDETFQPRSVSSEHRSRLKWISISVERDGVAGSKKL